MFSMRKQFSSYQSTIVYKLVLDDQSGSANNLIFSGVLNDGDVVVPTSFHFRKAFFTKKNKVN